jgi:hypothetical protein
MGLVAGRHIRVPSDRAPPRSVIMMGAAYSRLHQMPIL